ncbi:hypothetical protein CLOP_g18823 [Closterium sp. NIES-67]|nr:hypothetical protein CLOP_g18823 [Closterium sp. NIES-67]
MVNVVLRLDAKGRAVDFEAWLADLRLHLKVQRQDGQSLAVHVDGKLPCPPAPAALASDATSAEREVFTAVELARSIWVSRDAAAQLAISRALPLSERPHFRAMEIAKEFLDAVIARYSTPSSASAGRLLLSLLFPDLASFSTVANLANHLRALESSYRAASIEAQLSVFPPPIGVPLYLIAMRLPDRLATARDTFLSLHPADLTLADFVATLSAIETRERTIAQSNGTAAVPIFQGCAPSQYTYSDAYATIEKELQYQSALELNLTTFRAISHIPLASDVAKYARQNMVTRLDSYQQKDLRTFKEVVAVIDSQVIPIIRRSALSGFAIFNTELPVFFDQPGAPQMLADILAERGYFVYWQTRIREVPVRIDPATFAIECLRRTTMEFHIKFDRPLIRSSDALSSLSASSFLTATAAMASASSRSLMPHSATFDPR